MNMGQYTVPVVLALQDGQDMHLFWSKYGPEVPPIQEAMIGRVIEVDYAVAKSGTGKYISGWRERAQQAKPAAQTAPAKDEQAERAALENQARIASEIEAKFKASVTNELGGEPAIPDIERIQAIAHEVVLALTNNRLALCAQAAANLTLAEVSSTKNSWAEGTVAAKFKEHLGLIMQLR